MILSLTKPTSATKPTIRRIPTAHFSAVATQSPPETASTAATWTTLPGGVVEGGEIVILAIKPSMWRWLIDSAPWIVTALVAIYLTERGSATRNAI